MFHNDFEYFAYWLPTSANCLAEGVLPDSEEAAQWTDEKAFEYIAEPIKAHPELDFFIIAQSGDETDAVPMRSQMKYFIDQTDVFSYGLDPKENNIYYTCSDFKHVQQYLPYYLYTAKDVLFNSDI